MGKRYFKNIIEVVRLNNVPTPQYICILTFVTNECYLIWQKGLSRCDCFKDFEEPLFWIFWMGPKCNPSILIKDRQKAQRRKKAI